MTAITAIQQRQNTPKERRERLAIAKQLDKFIPLPNILNWKVHDSDVLARGRVLCYLRTKRTILPDRLTSLKMRLMTVTRHGFLVIYDGIDHGLVIDLRQASHILTSVDRFRNRRVAYRRSHLKIRLSHGNCHLFVRDERIAEWTNAILRAHTSGKCERRVVKQEQSETRQADDQLNTMDTAIEMNPLEDDGQSSTSLSSNSGMITVIENPIVPPVPSIRRGPKSVSSLRRQLERKLVLKPLSPIEETPVQASTSKFVSTMFVNEMVVVVDDDQDQENDQEVKKEWWNRSLRC